MSLAVPIRIPLVAYRSVGPETTDVCLSMLRRNVQRLCGLDSRSMKLNSNKRDSRPRISESQVGPCVWHGGTPTGGPCFSAKYYQYSLRSPRQTLFIKALYSSQTNINILSNVPRDQLNTTSASSGSLGLTCRSAFQIDQCHLILISRAQLPQSLSANTSNMGPEEPFKMS